MPGISDRDSDDGLKQTLAAVVSLSQKDNTQSPGQAKDGEETAVEPPIVPPIEPPIETDTFVHHRLIQDLTIAVDESDQNSTFYIRS